MPEIEQSAIKSCFVIAPIGREGSDVRKRSDQVLRHIIDPVILECGYSAALRADRISESGRITQQVIQHVADDDLVIADLTGSNPNVYYELALRHALGKPFVQLLTGSEPLPFDLADQRTIMIDYQDLDSVATAKDELARQVQALSAPDARVETPLSFSVDLATLRSSENPLENTAGEMLEMLQILVNNSQPAFVTRDVGADVEALRTAIERTIDAGGLSPAIIMAMVTSQTSSDHDLWAGNLLEVFRTPQRAAEKLTPGRRPAPSGYDEEPF
jgi:hypothetical protein